MALSVNDLLGRDRWQASKKALYLSRGLWAMRFIECDAIDTCGIDEYWRVYINPKYARKCADEGTLIGEILHECLHAVMRHAPRARAISAVDPQWNYAADIEIDQKILAMHVKLVEDRVPCPPGRENWTAEEHYHASLKKDGKKPREGGKKPHEGCCGGGSGTGGGPKPWELGKPGSKAPGSKAPGGKPAPGGLLPAEADIVRAQVAQAVRDHAKAKGIGSVPAGLLRWAEEFGEPPPIDYRLLVQARVRYVLDIKRGPAPTYARPSRRTFGPFVLPVYRTPSPTVAMVLDTSASMQEKDIGDCLASVHGAVESLGRVLAVPCDSEAYDVVEVHHVDDLRPFLKGGGGTSMRAGLARAEQEDPDAIVVVTDGGTKWPAEAPAVPVIIVLTEDSPMPLPEWAEVVRTF